MDQGDYCYYSSSNVKKSGQIPVFGNWDFTNELPITQYFECARQAGLGRYSSSSGECDPRSADLYSVVGARKAPRRTVSVNAPDSQKTKPSARREKPVALVNGMDEEKKKMGRLYDVTQPVPKVRHLSHVTNRSKMQSDVVLYPVPNNPKPSKAKAVDEDLYKIPPDDLLNNRKKKKLGFISRCLVPACSA